MGYPSNKNFTVKDYSVSKKEFELCYDEHYDLWNTYPKPSPEELSEYYDSSDYISHTDSRRSLTDKLYQQVKKWMFSYKFNVLQKHKNKGKILDIGAGTGDFLEEAKKRNWKITGVEPNSAARELAKYKGVKLESELSEISGLYDVITLWHVLEHVYDLKEYIRFLKAHLAENGVLLIAVPNFKSWDARKYKAEWAANDVPRHLYHFSKSAIERLFAEVNMELIDTKPLFFDSFYVSILSEKYRENNSPLLRGLLSGLKSNLSALHSKEYSSQIYILKHQNRTTSS